MKPWAKPLGTYIIRRLSADQLGSEALAERGRALPQIEDEIVKSAADTADELGLGLGSKLIMHAAERPLLGAERIVDLHEPGDKLVGGELLLAEGPGEEAAVIAPLLQVDQVGARDRSFR